MVLLDHRVAIQAAQVLDWLAAEVLWDLLATLDHLDSRAHRVHRATQDQRALAWLAAQEWDSQVVGALEQLDSQAVKATLVHQADSQAVQALASQAVADLLDQLDLPDHWASQVIRATADQADSQAVQVLDL